MCVCLLSITLGLRMTHQRPSENQTDGDAILGNLLSNIQVPPTESDIRQQSEKAAREMMNAADTSGHQQLSQKDITQYVKTHAEDKAAAVAMKHFAEFDLDHGGTIDMDELVKLILEVIPHSEFTAAKDVQYSADELTGDPQQVALKYMQKADVNRDQGISKHEAAIFAKNYKKMKFSSILVSMFENFDENVDDNLDLTELTSIIVAAQAAASQGVPLLPSNKLDAVSSVAASGTGSKADTGHFKGDAYSSQPLFSPTEKGLAPAGRISAGIGALTLAIAF